MAKAKDWYGMYNDQHHPDVGDTLAIAKRNGLKYYRHNCERHGKLPYTVLDNACPLCVREGMQRRRKENPSFNRPRELCGETKRRAKTKGLEHNLTPKFVREIMTDRCPIFDTLLEHGSQQRHNNSPSLDRIDNNKGYTTDNVAVMSDRANRIKSDGTAIEHLQIAIWQMRQEGKSDDEILQVLTNIYKIK